jgi:hypothetical protein
LNSEIQQIQLKLQAEQEKNSHLESLIKELNKSDNSYLILENSVLKSKVQSLEKDYEELRANLIKDFSSKELQISNLSETTYQLEEELKNYQELSLSKNKQNSMKYNELVDKVKELTLMNTELEQKLSTQTEEYEEEIENLKGSVSYMEDQQALKKKENNRLLEKIEAEIENSEKLTSYINLLEDKIKSMETENEELMKNINTNEKKIKSLSSEINYVNEDLIEQKEQEFESFTKEIKSLNSLLKASKDQCSILIRSKEEIKEANEILKSDLNRKNEFFEKEKKNLIDQIANLKNKLEACQKKNLENENQIRDSKDEVIKELQNRIYLLKQEKNELESTLQELQDQIQIGRPSGDIDAPLSDELSLLRDSTSRCSTPRNLTLEFKRNEKVLNEISEKEFQIQILKAENSSLKNQLENLVPSLITKLPEYQGLIAEKKRLETEMMLAKECWGNENNNLRVELEETEAVAINAKLRYAEAATDRDLYQKMYLDLKKSSSKKSWFKKNKS